MPPFSILSIIGLISGGVGTSEIFSPVLMYSGLVVATIIPVFLLATTICASFFLFMFPIFFESVSPYMLHDIIPTAFPPARW